MIVLIGLSAGCMLTSTPVQQQDNPPVSVPEIPPDGWIDASEILYGICFESAFDAREQVFIFRDEGELIRFFDLADNSGLCRRPVERQMFEFNNGGILAGLWSYGFGCTARHEVTGFVRDDAARTLTITAEFITGGDCPYELLRPFWMGLYGVADYEIILNVTGE